MNNENISRLEIVPVRKAFPHEAQHFTSWLESHIDALNERLGIELHVVQKEKAVGDFSLDLLCEDAEGRAVIIENQLEQTDHKHLGQLLTYFVNLNAGAAIWVTTEPRQEHQRVIEWLNESAGVDLAFYLVKVEATRIGNSPYAPLFTVLAGPDTQTKEIGEKKKEWAERHFSRLEFWKGLLERSKEKTKLFATISPGRYQNISTGAGRAGVFFAYGIFKDAGVVELYIDADRDTGKGNKMIFDALYAQKDAIEKEFGAPLEWERLDEKRASRIYQAYRVGGFATPDKWPELRDQMIDGMIRLDRALRGRLAKIEI
jgi:Domain of unknown function (DUF4268)